MKNLIGTLSLWLAAFALSGSGRLTQPAQQAHADLASTVYTIDPMRLGDEDSEAETSESEPAESIESTEAIESIESAESGKPCKVLIEKAEHGTIETDITEGEIGDIVTITAKHDLLYTVDFIAVNGVNLVEDENISRKYQFALAEGENVITARFKVDEELCGSLTEIVSQAGEKDWTNLFTFENVIVFIKWVFDGGVLFVMVKYFIRDKRLADKLEKAVKKTVDEKLPDATKAAVLAETKTLIEPMFSQFVQDSALARQLMCIMVKCMVLMQQNTPEAKVAILNEFEKLKGIVDVDSLNSVKAYIDESIANHAKAFNETLARLNAIAERHESDAAKESAKSEGKAEAVDDGTQI